MKMEGLSLYWNTKQNLFVVEEEKEDTSLLKLFVDGIAGKEEISSYNYSKFLR